MPGSFSVRGRQQTGTGTGTWGAELVPGGGSRERVGALAGSDHPYACSLPSSLRTCARTCRYCSLRSVARRAATFSLHLHSTPHSQHYCEDTQQIFLFTKTYKQTSLFKFLCIKIENVIYYYRTNVFNFEDCHNLLCQQKLNLR